MTYKVGDKVQIKDIDWYNENKDEYGYINCGSRAFFTKMSNWCGKIATIKEICKTNCYRLEEYDFDWTDEMIDCLVERNGKTYPYKIGDRVILKGNNRCATITDLKYNSQGNLSYYIKIDNDKDISIDYPTDLLSPYDNMNECKVEEETKPKFKVGDKVKDKNDRVWFIVRVSETFFDISSVPNAQGYFVPIEDQDDYELISQCFSNDIEMNGISLPNGYQFTDEDGNVINTQKIILKKKKKEYPKTYEECINELDTHEVVVACAWEKAMKALRTLLICRDAYWKIAGEEMGLDKPWEPNWNDEKQTKYGFHNEVKNTIINSATFVFPTAEMRDTFKDNFAPDIELCKEF